MRNVLLWCWTSLIALQSRRNLVDTRIRPAEDPDLPGEVTSGQGPALLLRHAAPGSDLLPPADGANSRTTIWTQKVLDEILIPLPQQSAIKEIPTASPDPLVSWPSNKGSPGPTLLIPCKKKLKEKSKRVAHNKGYPATVSKELRYKR